VELQSILLAPPCPFGFAGPTCIDPIFGPAPPGNAGPNSVFYWSSSSNATLPMAAWVVDFAQFGFGPFGLPDKSGGYSARAVRGGR
jgi:hypothetical protein